MHITVQFSGAAGWRSGQMTLTGGAATTIDVPPGASQVTLITRLEPADLPVPPPTREDDADFLAHVLAWMRDEQNHDCVSVEHVHGCGTDWSGDTLGGFHSEFDVTVHYTDSTGRNLVKDVTGEDMDSLWHWVVGSWPPPEPDDG